MDAARAPLIAYLPADDVLHREHLSALVARTGAGVLYDAADDLRAALGDPEGRARRRRAAARARAASTFDAHADRLVTLFREVIDARLPGG